MPKILSPGFPPRRASGVARYVLVATVLVILLYLYKTPDSSIPRPIPGAGYYQPASGTNNDHQDQSQPPPQPGPNTWEENPIVQPPSKPESRPAVIPAPEPGFNPLKENPIPQPPSKPEPKPAVIHAPESASEITLPQPNESPSKDSPDQTDGSTRSSGTPNESEEQTTEKHPIDHLISEAQLKFNDLVSKETKTLSDAARAYRKRRGRHPPPGFDRWFQFAQENNAMIVEDFFDQMYHDLEPYWGLEPKVLRKESWDFEMVINIRDGEASTISDWFWTVIWLDLIKTIAPLLPDMDLPLNPMDEPRHVVPWEDMEEYMKKASQTVSLPPAKDVRGDFQKLPEPGYGDRRTKTRSRLFKKTEPYWDIVRQGCAPDSLAQTTPLQATFDVTPEINMTWAKPHMHEGFVSNFSLATDVCHQPDLQGLQGVFIEPQSISSSSILSPMFGGSKLSVNNEILIPAPVYWDEEERFTGGDHRGDPWYMKENGVVWRGVATGGKNRATNWRGFQRHRFASMNNGTKITAAEEGESEPENFALPEDQYSIHAKGQLGNWVKEWADVAFVDLMCEPSEEDGSCPHTNHYFSIEEGIPMAEQFGYKFLPDIDGNSFSGRYLGFLRSNSLPIKATVWREWHDSRLVAWKHFVPMDSRFGDYYGIMDYFLGYRGKGKHDQAAEKIASDGKEWAEKVLRKEDMQIYMLRLFLEYGRILDDRRENMGWVNDALADPSIEQTW